MGSRSAKAVAYRGARAIVALVPPIALAAVLAAGRLAAAIEAAYSFRDPFQAEQCERAARFAGRVLAPNPTNPRGRLIEAEALLCEGIDDDPWALDSAIAHLQQIVVDRPHDFFAQLDLADALRKRFPSSAEAQQALARAQMLLAGTDVGAARADIAQYIGENAAAVAEQGARAGAFLRVSRAGTAHGALTSAETAELAGALALTGRMGLQQARRVLDGYCAQHPDDGAATLLRAELSCGCVSPEESRRLFVQAQTQLCRTSSEAPDDPRCAYVRWRLTQLARVIERHKGLSGMTGNVD